MTNLEKLNYLLQNQKLNIPEHVRHVHESGKNQQWLRKNVKNQNEVTPELTMLLAMTMPELKKTYVKMG